MMHATYALLPKAGKTEETTSGGVPVMKLLIIGDAGVGKSCFLWRFTEDIYEEAYVSTLGMDFKTKNLEIQCTPTLSSSRKHVVNKKQWVRLQIWDTAGQEKFRTITSTYYRGAHGALIVYAVNDRSSFVSVNRWLADFHAYAEKDTPVLLVGSKCDLEGERAVMKWEGEKLAKEFGCAFLEVSSKTNANVLQAFQDIAGDMYQVYQKRVEAQRTVSQHTSESDVPDFEALMPRKRKSFGCCYIN